MGGGSTLKEDWFYKESKIKTDWKQTDWLESSVPSETNIENHISNFSSADTFLLYFTYLSSVIKCMLLLFVKQDFPDCILKLDSAHLCFLQTETGFVLFPHWQISCAAHSGFIVLPHEQMK